MAAPQITPFPTGDALKPFTIDDDEPPLRWQRAVHLAPQSGPGVGRRAVFFALLGWVPIAVWALARGRFVHATLGEPLLQHYGVHIRCLVVIPLLILGEATFQRAAQRYLPQFITNGLVTDSSRAEFDDALRAFRRWRDASLPWLMMFAVAIGWTSVAQLSAGDDALSWALDKAGSIGFGGVWFAHVVRPIFITLLLSWLWRFALLAMFFVRIHKLNLSLVPSHPDRAGGLGFLEKLLAAFAPVSLALSTTLASRWAHEIVYHQQTLNALKIPAATFVVAWSLILFVPFLALMPLLFVTKRAALPLYAAMVAEQGRLVRRRWIEGATQADGPLIEPQGVGVIADAATMYNQVAAMRVLPFSKEALLAVLLPLMVPMLVTAALQVPIGKMLAGLVKTLM
jgi:hypothetical protein